MQILAAAGFPVVGEAFLGKWEDSIRDANPRGFFESPFRRGIYHATNPDDDGRFLFPQSVRRHAVKIFVPGLVRTDYAFIDHVVATMRHWREYVGSLERLHRMEDAYLRNHPQEGQQRPERSSLPAWLEWWQLHYDLIRDVATRRYRFHMQTYESLLEDPERSLGKVIAWLGGGDIAAAVAAVEPGLQTQRDRSGAGASDCEVSEILDELYDTVHRDRSMSKGFIDKLNATQRQVEELVAARRGPTISPSIIDKVSVVPTT
ncbi:MAG: hypothetical protein K0V04_43735 [Deltaproteobacteria bacterium]|nr:hypothetical protein [Deltaproteobacteria bacterium]